VKAAYDSYVKLKRRKAVVSVYHIYVCEDCVKTVYFKVSTRKTGDNLDNFNARLLNLKKPLQI